MKHNIRIWIGIVLIIIVCWFGYTYTEEINKISNAHKPLKQQVQRFIWLIVVGLITYWSFLKHSYKWLSKTIFIVYILSIFILGCLGLIEVKWRLFSENQKELISSIRLFLSSPLPFIIAWFLSNTNFNTTRKKVDESIKNL